MKRRWFILSAIVILCVLIPLWGSNAATNGLLATITGDNSDMTVTTVTDRACPRCGNQPAPAGSFVALRLQNSVQFHVAFNEETAGSGCASKMLPAVDQAFSIPLSACSYYCPKCGYLKAALDPISMSLFRSEKGLKVVSPAPARE